MKISSYARRWIAAPLAFLCLNCWLVLSAQNTPSREARSSLENSRALLQEVLHGAGSLRLPENQIYVSLSAARVLATGDPEQSMQVLSQAYDLTEFALASLNIEDDRQKHDAVELRESRRQILQELAGLNPARALGLLLKTQESDTFSHRYLPDRDLFLLILEKVSREEPELVLQAADSQLATGTSPEVMDMYTILRGKNPEIALRLAQAMVRHLAAEAPDAQGKTLQDALLLLSSLGNQSGGAMRDAADIDPSALDEASLSILMNSLADALIALDDSRFFSSSGTFESYAAQIEAHAPEKAQQLRDRSAKAHGEDQGPLQAFDMHEVEARLSSKNFEEALALADRAPSTIRQVAFQQVALSLLREEDDPHAGELAGRIVATQITDASVSQRVQNAFAAKAARQAAESREVHYAGDLLSRQLVESMKSLGALAAQVRRTPAPSQTLAVAARYIDTFNDLMNLAGRPGVAGSDSLRDGEFRYAGSARAMDVVTAIVELLLKVDGEGDAAIAVTAKFKRREFLLLARVRLAELLARKQSQKE